MWKKENKTGEREKNQRKEEEIDREREKKKKAAVGGKNKHFDPYKPKASIYNLER